VDSEVNFPAAGVNVHATLHHRAAPSRPAPAVLLIAGSGPTDRNGNNPQIRGSVDTLSSIATVLGDNGVVSLRYDKLGTGTTELGRYATNPALIGVEAYQQQASAALAFLAAQPEVNPARLGVIGHSEGALFALQLATTPPTLGSPTVHALALLEPLSKRYLDVVADQLNTKIDSVESVGRTTPAQADAARRALASTIASIRADGTVPSGLPPGLKRLFNAQNARFLSEIDKIDPAGLAAQLPAGFPVLLTCSDADSQVTCADVAHLTVGLAHAHTQLEQIALTGVDHVLKEDPSGTATHYGDPLPFSGQLRDALAVFASHPLAG
jgi:dienelactone hydrolase